MSCAPVAAKVELCVENGAAEPYLFAVEMESGPRQTSVLAPGEDLCISGSEAGVVSVFENADALEGCSRLVAAFTRETLMRYVDFDRCEWSSHKVPDGV